METKDTTLDTLKNIKSMMEQSSRFISLSGLSGIAAGVCALIGAWKAREVLIYNDINFELMQTLGFSGLPLHSLIKIQLITIAAITFIAAFILAFITTYLRSKSQNVPIWGFTAKRLLISVIIPLGVGAIFTSRLFSLNMIGLIAPSCLLFYGIALFCASKYTLMEIKYLGYAQIILGLINLWFIGYGLYFWAIGFGILHIVYGIYMWWNYERGGNNAK